MFDKFKQTITQAGDVLKEQAAHLGEAAKEKGTAIIDTWISVLPKLEAYGFRTSYFALSVSINPTLEVELKSTAGAFPMGRIQAILEENKDSTPVNLVFNSLKSTLLLHQRARLDVIDPLTVKIKVRLSPEIKVAFGSPTME